MEVLRKSFEESIIPLTFLSQNPSAALAESCEDEDLTGAEARKKRKQRLEAREAARLQRLAQKAAARRSGSFADETPEESRARKIAEKAAARRAKAKAANGGMSPKEEEPKDEPKEETKLEEPKEELKDELKAEPKAEPKEEPKVEPQEEKLSSQAESAEDGEMWMAASSEAEKKSRRLDKNHKDSAGHSAFIRASRGRPKKRRRIPPLSEAKRLRVVIAEIEDSDLPEIDGGTERSGTGASEQPGGYQLPARPKVARLSSPQRSRRTNANAISPEKKPPERLVVGKRVRVIVENEDKDAAWEGLYFDDDRVGSKGTTGQIMEDDGSEQPFRVKLKNGKLSWFKEAWLEDRVSPCRRSKDLQTKRRSSV
eukprot:g31104.t1